MILGTITYSLAEGWNVVDAFYFSVATLTTSSIADPDLEAKEFGDGAPKGTGPAWGPASR